MRSPPDRRGRPELIGDLPSDGRPVLLLVDDAELVDDASGALAALAAGARPATWLVAAGRPDALRQRYGHWTTSVRRSRMGVLLTGGSELDGDLLGAVVPRRSPLSARPGLAWVVDNGSTASSNWPSTPRSPSPLKECCRGRSPTSVRPMDGQHDDRAPPVSVVLPVEAEETSHDLAARSDRRSTGHCRWRAFMLTRSKGTDDNGYSLELSRCRVGDARPGGLHHDAGEHGEELEIQVAVDVDGQRATMTVRASELEDTLEWIATSKAW